MIEGLPGLFSLSGLDLAAAGWFLLAWLGYGWLAEKSPLGLKGLVRATHLVRLDWARQLLLRENRVADAALLGNLMQSISFYANTTIYIIAGLFAVLGTLDQLVSLTEGLPFSRPASRDGLELKLLLLIAVFVMAYFKFTWSLRQMNLLSILIGGAPASDCSDVTSEQRERTARRIARVNSYGGDEFNRGIRAYYFGLAALGWLINAWLFIAITTLVVIVLYRRDFASPTLAALKDEPAAPDAR